MIIYYYKVAETQVYLPDVFHDREVFVRGARRGVDDQVINIPIDARQELLNHCCQRAEGSRKYRGEGKNVRNCFKCLLISSHLKWNRPTVVPNF